MATVVTRSDPPAPAADNPYVAPQAAIVPAASPAKEGPSRLRKPGLYLLAAIVLGPAATLVTVAVDGGGGTASRVVMFVGFAAVTVCAALGAFHSIKNMRRRLLETEPVPARAKVFLSLALIANLGMMFFGAMGALLSTVVFNRG
ncbi:MAG: hypothetical protein ABI175_04850, partial [Polyangiales bacterium]